MLRISSLLFFILSLLIFKTIYAQIDSNNTIISEIKIIGNKSSKRFIILRELPFNVGDTIKNKDIQNLITLAEDNLLNTLLFNFVTIESAEIDTTHIALYITVEERWYWWPIPIFEIQETNFNTWWETKNLNRANYGIFLAKENFRGRKERLVFKLQQGYTQEADIRYYKPYLNKNHTQGITVGFSYNQNHEIIYNTTNNKRDFLKLDKQFAQKNIAAKINYEIRPKIYNKHNFEIRYNNLTVNDSVVFLNKDYLSPNNTSSQFISASYSFTRDKRNFKSYATKGYYLSLNLTKNGLGIFDKDLNTFFVTTNLKKYWQLGKNSYFSSSIKGKISLADNPYILLGGLGYINNLVRGYEYYVIDGKNYGLFKSQFRYNIFNNVFNVKPLPFNKFNKIPLAIYLGIFFDAGYVDDNNFKKTNSLNNQLIYGSGIALDIVSYYDIVFRVEYSINKQKEYGLFLHFIAPI